MTGAPKATPRIPRTLPTGCAWPSCSCTRTHCDQRPEPEPEPEPANQDSEGQA
jgi:hypothetical protein